MGQANKNSRAASTTHRFFCPCGGEVVMKKLFENNRERNVAECDKCNRVERRPSDFN
jgi:predicted SprT family Zn-dependent metalloprotease